MDIYIFIYCIWVLGETQLLRLWETTITRGLVCTDRRGKTRETFLINSHIQIQFFSRQVRVQFQVLARGCFPYKINNIYQGAEDSIKERTQAVLKI